MTTLTNKTSGQAVSPWSLIVGSDLKAELISEEQHAVEALVASVAKEEQPEIKKFVVGEIYAARSVCDYECIFSYTIIKRTDKNVWVKDEYGDVIRRKVYVWNNEESCRPEGTYSMCPVISAR